MEIERKFMRLIDKLPSDARLRISGNLVMLMMVAAHSPW